MDLDKTWADWGSSVLGRGLNCCLDRRNGANRGLLFDDEDGMIFAGKDWQIDVYKGMYIEEGKWVYPNKQEALRLLKEAETMNPGAWVSHSMTTAHCAEKIAVRCEGMNADKAYVLGLLHDIGRRFGVHHLKHVSDGYSYMMSLGYDEVARICLSHSFINQTVDEYVGRFDTTEEELQMIRSRLKEMVYNDYDKLIQLCDSIAGAEGVMDMEDRLMDVKRRYGMYPQAKWDANLALKSYFEEKMRQDLYEAVEKNSFKPCFSLL